MISHALRRERARLRLALARRVTWNILHQEIRNDAQHGGAFASALVDWSARPRERLANSLPVPLSALDAQLPSAACFHVQAFPEVADDLRELGQHKHGGALRKRLAEYIATVHRPDTRQQAHPLGRHRYDLSDLRSMELSIQNVPKPERKPFRLVFQEVGPPAAPTGICVVAIGEKIQKQDRVYGPKVAPRQGREEQTDNEIGLMLELRLALDTEARNALLSEMAAHQDRREPATTAASPRFLPAWPTIHGPPEGGSCTWWPFTDQVLIGYDNAYGRAALRACAAVVVFATDRHIPLQVRYG